ncbi:DUF45 domain-containing protein [Saccharibacter sp. EH611]|nr:MULTISPECIES: SprT family zinc-dependent metalloprotease [unclassified Saccharibacter]MXV36647.1 DUF45 domain-containing protein [Saccharibacter sp. EH611]MXV65595.1 DUF45 domain-containing protein [Saccharibacter sp. EH60]
MFAPPVIWKNAPRAKRLSLRIDIQSKAVVITLPPRASRKQGIALLHSQAHWISEALAALPASALERHHVLLHGRFYRLQHSTSNETTLTADALLLGGECFDDKQRLLKNFVHQKAKVTLPALIEHYSRIMGQKPQKITLRDTKSRWGSCTRQGRLMLNWRLIMAPDDIARYVIVHELAHMTHFNHSPAFWAHVDRFCPDGKKGRLKAEKYLHQNGILLMRMV